MNAYAVMGWAVIVVSVLLVIRALWRMRPGSGNSSGSEDGPGGGHGGE